MNDMLVVVTILAFLFVLIIWIMNILCRSTEKQTRHSSANLNKRNKIKPDVACNNQHALPRPEINDEFSTASGEDLNNQSFLQLKAKVDETNLIVLENQRLANELSLVQSQLTDSHSKLQMFQNVQEELASTKSELEEKKIVVTDLAEKNLRLTNNDSRLRRTIEDMDRIIIEDRDRIMASNAIEKNLILLDKERLENELSLLQSQLTDSSSKLQMFQNVHNELAATKSELENNKREMTDIKEINLRLTNDDSRLRRQIEAKDRIIEDRDRIIIEERDRIMASNAIEKNLILLDKERLENELSLLQSQLTDSSSKLQMFQNVHNELAATKSELENNKREMTDIKEINLRLTNDDSRLRRQIEAKDRIIEDRDRIIIEERDRIMASSAIEKNLELEKERLENELSLVQSQLKDSHSKLKQFRNESVTTKSKLEEKKSLITDMTDENSRLGRKIEDKDRTIRLILFDKESLANELSLLQSQQTFSPNRQMFQNLRDKLAATKSELENNKRLMTDITEKNLCLKKDDSRLRRKIEDRDRTITQIVMEKERLANELSLVQSQLKDSHSNLMQTVQKVHDELAATKSENENNKRVMTDMELELKNRTISELETEILRWTENDSQLRQQLEETDRLLQSSQAEMEELRVSQTERVLEHLQDQVKRLEEKKKKWKKPFENLPKWKIFKSKEMKPKLAAEVV
ncbi:intracellular protein transport protein USO1-like [Daphnia pulex]|uniref:intracellular protein transport protein USO1-like n=1 Tax=Daphnia pulex TaxID=6669 RepID=UPI001EDD7259|nr:intracellular protein transport protein USO1-like [Daphnia pulex]